MEHEHSGLLIAALVAIVAVVGLVILFTGAQEDTTNTGATIGSFYQVGHTGLCGCPHGYTAKVVGGHGGMSSCVCHKEPRISLAY